MIDLHSHTDASDGTFTAAELVGEAKRIGLKTLAITDHDTLLGYDRAVPLAQEAVLAALGLATATALAPETGGEEEGRPDSAGSERSGFTD